ncbi:amidohydrolase [Polynucleobacter sp. AP-Titi-500A-B4]|uniref:amidohydrolase family protein n=1 Tax=Polynucleobacter sp. AP-Titi-500A-B4 TaxID=2576923 RepID=UPI001BFE6FEA|nr:amidohydrolase family protein [Polynucleobacter sp. AP-Titi-500A-B4]QWE13190.1 amidohydrolase family protein [Polynucleobacter sp. AP-Titi-500A-B4]
MQEKQVVTGIDCHAHIMAVDLPLAPEIHSRPIRDVSATEYISVLGAHGISHGVLTAPSFYGPNNTLLLEALKHYPNHLRGTVIADPNMAKADLERQLLSMREHGVEGIRLNWIKKKSIPDITSVEYRTLLGIAQDLGLHIELFLEDHLQEHVVPQILASGATLVLDHFGNPDSKLGIHSTSFQNTLRGLSDGQIWVKLSAPYRLGSLDGVSIQPYIDALIAANPKQLVWASDWPWLSHENVFTYADCIDWIQSAVDDSTIWEDIFINNPKTLFHF